MTINIGYLFVITSLFVEKIGTHVVKDIVKNATVVKDIIKEEDLDDNVVVLATPQSPLSTSLLSGLQSPIAVKELKETIARFVPGNNPRIVREMKDSALYWVGPDGSPLTIKFPLLLDTQGQFSAIGPYFNLEKVITILHIQIFSSSYSYICLSLQLDLAINNRTLSRAKAIFEFRPIPEDEDMYPKEAYDSYRATFMMLSILTTELEDDRNNGASSPSISFPLLTNIPKAFQNLKEHQNSPS